MHATRPARLFLLAFPLLLAPIAFAAAAQPWWINEDFRDCLGIAADDELHDRVDLYDDYYEAQLEDLRSYRRSVRSGWGISDETSRKTFLKQIDREYATLQKNRQSVLTDRLNSLKENKADAEANCKLRQTEAKKFAAAVCTSTVDCPAGRYCTVDTGTCNQSCPFWSIFCVPSCAGTCVK